MILQRSLTFRHADVEDLSNGDIVLHSSDLVLHWHAKAKYWELSWKWLNDREPAGCVGSGLGEYPRTKLSSEQEDLFEVEVAKWLENGWMVPHDSSVHGEPRCVLPLLAASQEHKASTPVKSCLDYRLLNRLLV